MSSDNIRNFCIIAHIDAGKSTLADRFLELTGAVEKGKLRAQFLDQMDLEQERGITIKLQPVRLNYQGYVLNLVDTPGHVDFSYEVSRTLAVVEGAILLIDGTKGIQAQTLSVLDMALKQKLAIIPVINKIDLAASQSQLDKIKRDLKRLLPEKFARQIFEISAKTGQGVEEVLAAIPRKVYCPPVRHPPAGGAEWTGQGRELNKLKALGFDSHYDKHRGVVVYIRVFQGQVRAGDEIKFMATGRQDKVLEVGIFTPALKKVSQLFPGEIGYLISNLKSAGEAQIGDTLILAKDIEASPLPGYQKPQPMIFASVFPAAPQSYPLLSQSLEKLALNDSSFVFQKDHSPILGAGFELGLLGLLHLDILLERLRREYGLDLISLSPSPLFQLTLKNGSQKTIKGVWQLPDMGEVKELSEPYLKVAIISPQEYLGSIMSLITNFRGALIDTQYLDQDKVSLTVELPILEMVQGFYDRLKSCSQGYASLNYQFLGFRPAKLTKLEVALAEEKIGPLAILVREDKAQSKARDLALKLKNLIPRAVFEIRIQVMQGGKILASERISALKKDVTGHLYGGDVTRKRKLWEKQKKGKQRLQKFGKVDLPPEIFLKLLG